VSLIRVTARTAQLALIVAAIACVSFATLFRGQVAQLPTKSHNQRNTPIDVLSDTKGFNMKPYLMVVIEKVRANWVPRIPRNVRSKRGQVAVEFRVLRDGEIDEEGYGRISGKKALDSAAYEAVIASSPLPPLPSEFPCQFIKLRFHFYYNPKLGDVKGHNYDQPVPCVTTRIEPAKEEIHSAHICGRIAGVISLFTPMSQQAARLPLS
jgi:TonB family protein